MASRYPVIYDEAAYEGDAYSRQYAFTDDAGAILNTDGWSGAMTVKASKDDTTALVSTAGGEITVLTGVTGTEEASTTLSADAAADDTAITVSSATSIAVNQYAKVTLDSGDTHVSVIADVAGTSLTLTDALPSAAASGKAVVTYSNAYCVDVYIAGADLTDDAGTFAGLVGYYDLALTDPTGREVTFLTGRFCIDGQVG